MSTESGNVERQPNIYPGTIDAVVTALTTQRSAAYMRRFRLSTALEQTIP
jgi:hypothetical protein